MTWNWQLPNWPEFTRDPGGIREREAEFLQGSGKMVGACAHLDEAEIVRIRVELLSEEALETSAIEGEFLNRESLQSSVRRHFGLPHDGAKSSPAEQGVAEMLVDVFQSIDPPLDAERLFRWHAMIMKGRRDLKETGRYRTAPEAMQIVSGALHTPKVHYEAPPSAIVPQEMKRFLDWFNATRDTLPALERSALAHLHFESIHPFEDGNGRIGRTIAELSLSQSLGRPLLLALSQSIGMKKKHYYQQLGMASRTLEITEWIRYFADTILEAQGRAIRQVEWVIAKGKFFARFQNCLNPRQEKVMRRLFDNGPEGFTGGLSAGNYASLTKVSTATVTRDLAELVEMGALARSGERKHTRYRLDTGS